ncbi:MAG: hypothetical protein IPN71_02720 [Fibrobacteres bacterium]|nr:hypothetical protein [Fibrobacterota bacterium]
MPVPLSNIHPSNPTPPQPVRVPPVLMGTGTPQDAAKAPNQDSPFGPDYILETKKKVDQGPPPEAPKSPERTPPKPQPIAVAGVVPFSATSGPAADLAALPPLEPLGTEALTELSLNKLMQPSPHPPQVT